MDLHAQYQAAESATDDDTVELVPVSALHDLAKLADSLLCTSRKLSATREAASRGQTTYVAVHAAQEEYAEAKAALSLRVAQILTPQVVKGGGI